MREHCWKTLPGDMGGDSVGILTNGARNPLIIPPSPSGSDPAAPPSPPSFPPARSLHLHLGTALRAERAR